MPTREEMRNLGQGIIASFEARTAGIVALRGEVREQRQATQVQVRELDRSHQAMAGQLRADLDRGHEALSRVEARRKTEVNGWLKEVDRAHHAMAHRLRADLEQGRAALGTAEARRKTEVNGWLKEVDRAYHAMAHRLRADLARGHAGLSRAENRRNTEVRAWLGGVAAEHAGGHQEWQRLAVTMAARRSGSPEVPAAPRVRPARQRPEVEEEAAVAEAVVGPVTEELTGLGDRVFQYLANHPDGTRLTEIEREFGLARLPAARVVRHLMDEGKAEKRDLSYFAT